MKFLIVTLAVLALFLETGYAAKGIIVTKGGGSSGSAARGIEKKGINAINVKLARSASNITKPNIIGPGGMQVNSFTGNLLHQREDVSIPSRGLDIDVTFSYNSGLSKNDWGMGNGWTSTFNMMYEHTPGHVVIRGDDGRKDSFAVSGTVYSPPVGVFNELSEYLPGKFSLKSRHGLLIYFDDSIHKKITRIQDPNDNTITFSGFVSGQPSLITDANGRSIRLNWTAGRLTSVLDSIASPPRTTTYLYDTRGNLTQVTDPAGNVYQYQYDARNRMTRFIDERSNPVSIVYSSSGGVSSVSTPGNASTDPTTLAFSYNPGAHQTTTSQLVQGGLQTIVYTYDGLDRLVQVQGCCGLNELYQYDAQNNITQTFNSNGGTTTNTYDTKGNLLSSTDALGQTESWTYEPLFSRVTTETDKKGNTTSFSYDTRGNLLSISRPLGVTESFTYDASGNLTSSTDGRGTQTTYAYDGNGYLLEVTEVTGTTSFSYDNSGNLTSHTDKNSRTTTYAYDALDRVISSTNAAGGTRIYVWGGASNLVEAIDENGRSTGYAYDALNRVVAVTRPEGTALIARDQFGNVRQTVDFKGNTTTYGYDQRNRVTSITNPAGHSSTMTYDNNSNLLTETDFKGNTTVYLYDALNRGVRATDALGNQTMVTYDPNDNPVSVTDPLGRVTTHTYDALDRVTQTVHPIGTESFTYDQNDNLLSETDPNGRTTSYTYGVGPDRVFVVTVPSGASIHYTYDPAGNPLSVTDLNGLTSTYSYDALHRMVAHTNPMSEITSFTYDAVGNRTSVSLPTGNVLSYSYDASDRLTSSSDVLGLLETYTYDANSNVVTSADAMGNTSNFFYDQLDRVIAMTAPLGQSTLYGYDNNSNVTSMTDGAGNTTTMTYDALDRQLTQTIPGGLTTTYAYSPVGTPSSVTDARGNATTFLYDAMDRVTTVTYANGSSRTCTYDPAGNKTSLVDQNGATVTYLYDVNDRLVSRGHTAGSDVFTYDNGGRLLTATNAAAALSWTYDAADRVLTEVLNGKTTSSTHFVSPPSWTSTAPSFASVSTAANVRLQPVTMSSGGAPVMNYAYDAASRLVSQTRSNGSSSSYGYNNNDWPTSIAHDNGPAHLAAFSYTFDNRGFQTTVEKLHKPTRSEKYLYDPTTRLSGYQEGTLVGGNIPAPVTQTQFTFDGVGNRITSTKDAVATTYASNLINSYTSVSGGISLTPTYDANGNMTSDGSRAFTYDYMDRLTGVFDVATSATYQYDALGRRVQKNVNGAITKYFYNGDDVVEERDSADAVLRTFLVDNLGNRPPSAVVVSSGSGLPPEQFFCHYNSLGSLVALTDDSARVVERYEYDAFGKPSIFDSAYVPLAASAYGVGPVYGGQDFDGETGIYGGGGGGGGIAYHPVIGRFMQRDPLATNDGPPDAGNGYSYNGNNPSYGRFAPGPRQTTSLDGGFSRHRSDGPKITASQNSQSLRKGWDGTIKGITDEGTSYKLQSGFIYATQPGISARHTKSGHVTLLKRGDESSGKKEFKGHVTLLKRGGDDAGSAKHTKSGHVTLMKRGDAGSAERKGWDGTIKGIVDDDGDDWGLARHTKTGHVTLLKRGDESSGKKEFKGHVTLMKRGGDAGSRWDQDPYAEDAPTTSEWNRKISDVRIVHPPGTPPGLRIRKISDVRIVHPPGTPPGLFVGLAASNYRVDVDEATLPMLAKTRTPGLRVRDQNGVVSTGDARPGQPIKGISVKGGRNPGGNIGSQDFVITGNGKKEFKGHVTLMK